MRQHVNPLSRFFQIPIDLPDPDELFYKANLPIHLDIGSARGKFLLKMASIKTDWNYLGIEIRKPLVVSAEREREQLDLDNLKFLFCNANVSLESWLLTLPEDRLQFVSIQFPDPWFKKRHQKRRVLQPSLLISIAQTLSPGRKLFIQSDLLSVIQPMADLINLSDCFYQTDQNQNEWLATNPLLCSTEREDYVSQKGLPIYRKLYIRNQQCVPNISKFK